MHCKPRRPKPASFLWYNEAMQNKPNRKKLILLFDFDGTLADTLAEAVAIINRIGPEYNLKKINSEELAKLRKMSAREVIKYSGLPLLQIPFIISRVKNELRKNIEKIEPAKDIKKVIEELSNDKYEMGIVTSNLKESVEKFLENHDINFFSYIHSENNIFGKGQVLKKVMDEQGLDPGEVIYFGDEVRDIDAARSAGIRIISVSWGFNAEEKLREHNPDWLIHSPEEILRILKSL